MKKYSKVLKYKLYRLIRLHIEKMIRNFSMPNQRYATWGLFFQLYLQAVQKLSR